MNVEKGEVKMELKLVSVNFVYDDKQSKPNRIDVEYRCKKPGMDKSLVIPVDNLHDDVIKLLEPITERLKEDLQYL